VFRRLALITVAALAVAGCKPLTLNAPGPAGGGKVKAAAQSGPLFTEPGAGFSPVYRLIGHARHYIDITMYEFSDATAEHGLAAAARRGVRVKVILDRQEKSTNDAAFHYLAAHGVKVTWSSPAFEYTHQKTIDIDGKTALIMTANLTSQYYATSRDFLIEDTRHADLKAITAVFSADFAHRSIQPSDGRDLVWSPTNSQATLLGLIDGAKKTLLIYSEEMGDTTIEDALIKAAQRGVSVKVCGENTDGEYDSAFARLAKAGVKISYYSSPSGFYIHGKVVEADYGTNHAVAFIGSENFSSTSLRRNRELGLVTADPKVLASMAKTFRGDFSRGTRVH
jgi:phosphatidylserine/phosphatidylglycerophosphate/cardiolipin synthase-like enzyme